MYLAQQQKLGATIRPFHFEIWFGLFFFFLRPRQLLGYIADGPQDRASGNFMCCHSWDRAGWQWLLSQPVTLYWHRPNQYGAGGHSGDRTRALYRLSYRAPLHFEIRCHRAKYSKSTNIKKKEIQNKTTTTTTTTTTTKHNHQVTLHNRESFFELALDLKQQ